MRRRRTVPGTVVAAAVAAGCLTPVVAAQSDASVLTWSAPTSFHGGPLFGTYKHAECLPTSCVKVPVRVTDAVASGWASNPGGLTVDIRWEDVDAELDLFVYDSDGNELEMSNLGGVTRQRVFVANPPAGTYEIWIQSFSGAGTTFDGVAALGVQAPQQVRSVPSSLRFSPVALVDPQVTTGEPGLRLAPNGQAFVDAPWHASTATSFVWRSSPAEGNLTFRLLDARLPGGAADPRHRSCSGSSGGADTDIAVGSGGTLLLADAAVATVGVSRSTDNGATWSCAAASSTVPDDDRPWIAMAPGADGAGEGVDAYLAYHAFSLSGQFAPGLTSLPSRLQIDRTTDGGRTWQSAGAVADGTQLLDGAIVQMKDPGPVFTDRQGGVFVPFSSPDGRAYLARSVGGGRQFSVSVVAERLGSPSYAFVTGAADAAGTLYVAWVDQGTYDLVYSVSSDRGLTWSEPLRLNPPGSTAVFPWVAAGRHGDVAIGWYGSDHAGRPDLQPARSTWYPYVARSLDADAPHPVFQRSAMTTAPVHVGPLCVPDTTCDAATRIFGDFFMVAIDKAGALRAAFNDDAGAAAPYVVTVTQTRGFGIRAAGSGAVAESRGDAIRRQDGATTYVPQLDVVTPPRAAAQGASTALSFSVASSANLAKALSGTVDSLDLDAYWLATWQNSAGRLRFAAMHADRNGAITFFGGTTPGAAMFGPDSGYATYADGTPAGKTPVMGAIGSDGSVTMQLPSWLAPAGDVYGLQVFTLAGLPQAGEPAPLQLVDSTAPVLPSAA